MTNVRPTLSRAEYNALEEVAKFFNGTTIASQHADRLLELRLIYRMLGELRITSAGSALIRLGRI
jgi:hypothetical protein